MSMHSLIHPNRSGCLKMRATDAAGSGSGGTASVTAWQPESELAQLQTEVFAVTGVKVSADDPIMAVLVIQKRDMQAYTAELTRRQDEQQDIFLANFRMQAQEVSQAAENLAKQQQQIVNTVLKANSDYLESMENKLLGSVAVKIRNQNQNEQQMFISNLKKSLLLFGCVFLMVQVVLLTLFAVLFK